MLELAPGWRLVVDASAEWLFFRLEGDPLLAPGELPVAEAVWTRASQEHITRIVFEVQDRLPLTSFLIGQLILLHKRTELSRGAFRLCGLKDVQYSVLKVMRLDERLPNYATREDAVLGRKPV